MSIEEGPLVVESPQESPKSESQPATAAQSVLDDAAVRQAIARAEAQGRDPESLTVSDLSQNPTEAPAPKLDVPEKFRKPDGEADVEKIQASTKQLDEAIQKKTAAVKTVEDYLREYREKENQFRQMPNPSRLAADLPVPQPSPAPQGNPANMSDQQLREILMRDYQTDPIATTAQLIEIAIQKRLEPYEKERQDNVVRGNLEHLIAKDPRVMQPEVFEAIKAKLDSNSDLWKLKNPHKAAWLEVKEELRLGDPPAKADSAQPSKIPSPVLGGGTPPSSPSSSGQAPRSIDVLKQLDPRDKKQEAMGDEMVRSLFARER